MSDAELDNLEEEISRAGDQASEALKDFTPVDPELVVRMSFTDHRGIRSQHLVMPDGLHFSEKDGWFLEAFDLEKNELRMFSLFSIHGFSAEAEQGGISS